jgi:hypothetical protein
LTGCFYQQFQIQISQIEKHRFPHRRREFPGCGAYGVLQKTPAQRLRQKKRRPSSPALGGFPPLFTEQGYPAAVEIGIPLNDPGRLFFFEPYDMICLFLNFNFWNTSKQSHKKRPILFLKRGEHGNEGMASGY